MRRAVGMDFIRCDAGVLEKVSTGFYFAMKHIQMEIKRSNPMGGGWKQIIDCDVVVSHFLNYTFIFRYIYS